MTYPRTSYLPARARYRLRRRHAGLAAALLVLLALVAGIKAWRLTQRAQALQADAHAIAALAERRDASDLAALGPLLRDARTHAAALRAEALPLLPVADRLGWVPRYGPTIAAARPLLDAATELTMAADEAYTSLAPLLRRDPAQPLGPAVARALDHAHPRLLAARSALAAGTAALDAVPTGALPASLGGPLQRLRPLGPLAADALDAASAAPDLLGLRAPRTYLVLAQNPDELRATGGLITAAGTFTLDKGALASIAISDSVLLDDVERYVYPDPPAPLRRYMDSEQWLFRDSNWSPDFPTAARAGLNLYQPWQPHSIGGVIALDPRAIELLLAAIGPVTVADNDAPLTADTVLAYMRDGGNQQRDTATPWGVRRKAFLQPLMAAMLARLGRPERLDGAALAAAAQRMLDERHLQLYVPDGALAAVLARRGWDGAVRPGDDDFLMVVDSNLGYNKANVHVRQALGYYVDLADPAVPTGKLTVRYAHTLQEPVPCDQARGYEVVWQIARYDEWTAGCYWDLLRVLAPRGIQLLSATAHATPGDWMDSGVGDDGATLLGEGEGGASVLSTFLVVPAGATREQTFRYLLPPSVVRQDADGSHYRLAVQKQAGVDAVPIAVSVRLPPGSVLTTASQPPTRRDGDVVTWVLDLTRDQAIELSFS